MHYPDLNRPPDFTEFVHRHAGILGRHCWLKVFFMIILSKKKEKRNRHIFSRGNYEPYAHIRFKKALFSISLWCILSWLLFWYIWIWTFNKIKKTAVEQFSSTLTDILLYIRFPSIKLFSAIALLQLRYWGGRMDILYPANKCR